MNKITILTPTYNDAESILETLQSVLNQSYQNYEHIIIDDGSTDQTKEIIFKFKKEHDPENKIQYLYQENQDQLKAIIHGLEKATGSYAIVLHSDDVFASHDVLEQSLSTIETEKVEALIGPLTLMDMNGKIVGTQKVKRYQKKAYIPPLQLLWLGRNLYADTGFFKMDTFRHSVYKNYLRWNCPFWLNTDSQISLVDVKTVSFPLICYRVHEGNYIHSELGVQNVLNGEIRIFTRLMHYYHIPCYRFQYFLFRVFSHLKLEYHPIYIHDSTRNPSSILKFMIEKRCDYRKYSFLDSLIQFYQKKSDRSIFLSIPNEEYIYEGNDMRLFNQNMLENKLSSFHIWFLEEMKQGFSKIMVSKEDFEKTKKLVAFFCIEYMVTIEIGEENKNESN